MTKYKIRNAVVLNKRVRFKHTPLAIKKLKNFKLERNGEKIYICIQNINLKFILKNNNEEKYVMKFIR